MRTPCTTSTKPSRSGTQPSTEQTEQPDTWPKTNAGKPAPTPRPPSGWSHTQNPNTTRAQKPTLYWQYASTMRETWKTHSGTIRASIDLADQHGYTEEEISILEGIESEIAGGSDSTREPEFDQQYQNAGAALDSQRDGTTTWADGSHWRDGSSHQLPDVPLEPAARILSKMTCAQWEALNMAVFPQGEGYSEFNWQEHPNADRDRAKVEGEPGRGQSGGVNSQAAHVVGTRELP